MNPPPPPSSVLTVQNVANPRIRNRPENAPAQKAHSEKDIEEAATTHQEMQAAIDDILGDIEQKSEELGKKYNKKKEYFLDWIFHGGGKMIHHHEKTSDWNAYKSERLEELKADGASLMFSNKSRCW